MTHPVVLDDECRLCVVCVIRKLNPDARSPPASTLLQAPEVGGLQQRTDRVVHQLLQATLDTLLEQGLDLQAQAQVRMAVSSYFKLHAVCCAAMQAAAGRPCQGPSMHSRWVCPTVSVPQVLTSFSAVDGFGATLMRSSRFSCAAEVCTSSSWQFPSGRQSFSAPRPMGLLLLQSNNNHWLAGVLKVDTAQSTTAL